jgi:hypothetical protein
MKLADGKRELKRELIMDKRFYVDILQARRVTECERARGWGGGE